MQLGKKSKTTNAFEQIRGELGPEAEASAPLVTPTPTAAPAQAAPAAGQDAVHITVAETISAKLSREGSLESFEVKGDLQLRISDASMTQVKIDLAVGDSRGAQLNSHPRVDRNVFRNDKVIQLQDTSKGFPVNNSIGVVRWRLAAKPGEISDPPITFTAWVNEGSPGTYNVTLEYELTGSDTLQDVSVSIPFATSEPSVSSFDAVYEVSGDSIDWNIGEVSESNSSGSFEFEAQAESESEFFPMSIRFAKTQPFVDIDVSFSGSFIYLLLIFSRSRQLRFSTWIRTFPFQRMSSQWARTTWLCNDGSYQEGLGRIEMSKCKSDYDHGGNKL